MSSLLHFMLLLTQVPGSVELSELRTYDSAQNLPEVLARDSLRSWLSRMPTTRCTGMHMYLPQNTWYSLTNTTHTELRFRAWLAEGALQVEIV